MKKKKKQLSKDQKKQESISEAPSLALPDFKGDCFFDMVPDLLCIVSADGYFKRLNSAWEHTLGFTTQELLASPFVVFIHPDDIEASFQALEKQTIAHEIINFDNRYRCKDGSYKWLEWRAKVSKDGSEIHAVAREITDWKFALDHLREREGRYKTLFENAPLKCQTLDTNGNLIQVNKKWIEIFGYSVDEITGKWFGDFLSTEFANAFREQFLLFKTKGNIHSEFEMIRKDGTQIMVSLDGTIAYKPTGSFEFAHCILQDITESRKAQESALKSEKKLRAIIESSDDAMLVLNNSGKSIYSNSKFNGMWGIPTDKLGLGDEENLLNFVVNRLQELKKILNKVKDLNQSLKADIAFVEFKDGRTFELRSHPWLLDNQILGRVLYLRDNTEKIKVENAMKESEERFRFLAEYSPNLIFIITNRKLVYVNKQCETITGYSQEAFADPGFDYLKMTAPECQGLVKEKYQLLMAGQPVDPFEYVLINKNGNTVYTLLSTKRIQFGGEHAIIGIITDITDHRKADKVTKQKVESLESYHNLMVGRELKIIDLKKEINKLLLLLGEKEKYKIVG